MAKIGDIIGGYRLIAEIGRGGFASVFTGKHIIFHEKPIVAIKVLHAHLTLLEQDLFIQEALQEAQLLAQLKHSHILRVLDAGIYERSLYLITEFAPNGSLRDRLQRQNSKPLPLDEAIQIISQVGQALHYAHEQNIVHCDLKPDNILFNAKGEALLADFGIAVVLSSGETRDIGRRGTVYYMAPEQFEGKASPKSDQYALGCIAYELFTGQRPFNIPHASLEVMWYHHAKIEPTAPKQLNPQLPVHIEQAILKAITKERTNRFANISMFIAALQKSSKQWLQEGKNLFDQMHYEEAVVAFEQAIQMDPSSAAARYQKGYISILLGRYKEAADAYMSATILDPELLITHIFKDNLPHFLELNSYEEVLSTLIQTIVYILDQHIQPASKFVLTQIFRAGWLSTQVEFLKGGGFKMPDDYEEGAINICDHTIELAPYSSLAYFAKATVLRMLDRKEEINTTLNPIVELVQDSPLSYFANAVGLASFSCEEEADIVGTQGVELVPNSPLAHFVKVIALYALRRKDEANTILDQHVELVPDSLLAYFAKVYAFNILGRGEEVTTALDQDILFVPNALLARLSKIFALYIIGREDEADTGLDKVLQRNLNSLLAHLFRVVGLMVTNNEEETLMALKQMISFIPGSPFAYLAKAIVLLIQRSEEEALPVLDQAIRLDPDLILAHSLKAFVLYSLDNKEEALVAIEHILQLISKSAIAHSFKTFVLYDLNRWQDALDALENVLRLIPGSALAHLFKAVMLYDLNYVKPNQISLDLP